MQAQVSPEKKSNSELSCICSGALALDSITYDMVLVETWEMPQMEYNIMEYLAGLICISWDGI